MMDNIEELHVQLGDTLNITKVIEIKPYSALLVIARCEAIMPQKERDWLGETLKSGLEQLLEGQKIRVLFTPLDFELDFYRIDPTG